MPHHEIIIVPQQPRAPERPDLADSMMSMMRIRLHCYPGGALVNNDQEKWRNVAAP